jgi:hypothetical protein
VHTRPISLTLLCTLLICTSASANDSTNTAAPPTVQLCNGTFSNNVKINPTAAVYMPDVGYIDKTTPVIKVNNQSVCDVHSFAWNQFLYYTQNDASGKPRFMALAPWYNNDEDTRLS